MIPKCIGGVSDHLPKETRRIFRREIPLGICCARSHRTLRDGSFEGRFPRHFVPGYDRCVPTGRYELSGIPILKSRRDGAIVPGYDQPVPPGQTFFVFLLIVQTRSAIQRRSIKVFLASPVR
jgi:hypothetical protein